MHYMAEPLSIISPKISALLAVVETEEVEFTSGATWCGKEMAHRQTRTPRGRELQENVNFLERNRRGGLWVSTHPEV